MDDTSKHDESVPLVPHAPPTPVSHPGEPDNPSPSPGIPESDSWSADTSTDEDEVGVVPHRSTFSTRSQAVLGNFFFATSLIALIIVTIFFIVIYFTVLQDAWSMNDRVFSNTTGISILGYGLQLDLGTCVLSISWKVVVCGADTTSEDAFWDDARVPTNCKPFDKALDIYLNDPSNPIFSFVPHTEPMSKRLNIWGPPTFTTEHGFNKYGKRDPIKDLMTPFQHYSFNAVAFAIDPTTNHSVHIVTFDVLDTLGNFVIRSHDMAETSNLAFGSEDGSVTTEVESRLLRAEITLSTISKAFAIWLFLANWTLAIGSVYATALVTFGRLEASNMVAALPFSALLTIPTIRSLCIVSPPFGTPIDTVAFFVQIAIVGFCSLVLVRVLTSCGSPALPPAGLLV